MGLDLILGLFILAAAVRGWFRGFVLQGLRLGGLIGSVYAAAPLRDAARPYINEYLPTIRPELLDRLLWWAAAIVCYAVTVGLASLAVKMVRRRPFGEVEPNRTDQFAGFLVGAAKGALIAAFVTAGLHRHALERVKGIDWAEHQARDSYALQWETDYHPADRVWASTPVRHFVAEIRRKGLITAPADVLPAVEKPVQAAATEGPPRLDVGPPRLDPGSPDFLRDLDRAIGNPGPEGR